MKAVEVVNDIYHVNVNIAPDTDYLFEGLWPIPNGVSINSYIVKGQKSALIDSWCTTEEYCPVGVNDLEKHPGAYESILATIGLTPKDIAYVIVNHMEPDHSGWLGNYLKHHPETQIICTKKAKPMLESFYGLIENIRTVSTGDTLDLGNGKELVFYEAPNVHWPEVMVTFEKNSGTLFSCDAFGSYGSVSPDGIFDDQLPEDKIKFYESETLRYYANIVASFSSFVLSAINALGSLPIKIIAPSHGIVWRKDPLRVINHYVQLANYATSGGDKVVTILWSSMYGNTAATIETIRNTLTESGISYYEHRIPQTHSGFALADVWRSKGLIIAAPTYEYKMFPPMSHLLDEIKLKHMKNKYIFTLGSYGWAGGGMKDCIHKTEGLSWEHIPSVAWAGKPTAEVLENIKKGVHALLSEL